jgi:hypothetical protein
VSLHQELAANFVVIIYNYIINALFQEFFAASQSGWTSTNYGDCCFININRFFGVNRNSFGGIIMRDFANIFNAINLGNANPADLTVNQHFAGTTFANSTFEAALAVRQTVAVYRETCLVQGCRNGKTFFAGYGNPFKLKANFFAYRHFKNRVFAYFIHFCIG